MNKIILKNPLAKYKLSYVDFYNNICGSTEVKSHDWGTSNANWPPLRWQWGELKHIHICSTLYIEV